MRQADIEEIAPNRFLVREARARPFLKGEGRLEGHLFELRTWRRAGLLARLRERGISVATLADQIDALPAPPAAPKLGPEGWRALARPTERYSVFDPELLRWRPIEPVARDGEPGVTARAGEPLRRRQGRGAATYHRAVAEQGGRLALQPLDETEAVLLGLALARARDDRPLLAERRPATGEGEGGGLLLPDIELPPPYRPLLRKIAVETGDGLLVSQEAWPLAQRLFERLGLGIRADR